MLNHSDLFSVCVGDQLSLRSIHGIPIASILSAGVSVYLDQSDRGCRLKGMRIAREFSQLLGHKIVFDELEAEDERLRLQQQLQLHAQNRDMQKCRIESSSSGAISGGPRAGQVSLAGSDIDNDGSDSGSDVEIVSEIEGYDCPDENPEDSVPRTNYLRVCLELLLAPDTDKDAHDKQLAALQSVPRIVGTNPVDAGDVCGPLLKELLRLNNNFNTDNFDHLRNAAVQALLIHYPSISAPVLCWVLDEEIFSIGVRVFAISSLARSAFALSGVAQSAEILKDTCNLHINNEIQRSNQSNNPINDQVKCSMTTITKPLKLATLAKLRKIVINNFNPVAPLFFYPILKLLAKAISNTSYNRMIKRKDTKHEKGYNFIDSNTPDVSNVDKLGSSFIRNSLSVGDTMMAVNQKEARKKGLSGINEIDEGDGLHSMVPVESLLALASFIKCSANSTYQRYEYNNSHLLHMISNL